MDFLKRTWAQIHLDAIRHNYRQIRRAVSANSKILSVVKADAYGHGAVQIATCLQQQGTDWFGVSNLDEAIQLRRGGILKPILILSYTPPEKANELADMNITQTVVGLSYAQQLNREAEKAGVKISVHIKIDTGMSRVGLMAQTEEEIQQTQQEVAEICRMPHLHAQGIFTHFATADEPNENFTQQQYRCFVQIINSLQAQGISFELRHCCNSAATLLQPSMHLDMVRPGLILYGLLPFADAEASKKWDLRPAMELKTSVSLVKEVPAGATFGYGRTQTALSPMKIATVAIGYADGFPRILSEKAYMSVNGKTVPVVGRISMDQCMLDISSVGEVQAGDIVTVFGKDADNVLPVENIASQAQTLSYEIVCLIGKRVPRLYLDGGETVASLHYFFIDAAQNKGE